MVITLLGILGLTIRDRSSSPVRAVGYTILTGGQPVELIFAGIIMIRILTSSIYLLARE